MRLPWQAIAFWLVLPGAALGQPPRSVISLNLCTDQLVAALAEPGAIMGLSPFGRDAARSSVVLRTATAPILSGTAEEVLLRRPDLVVAGRHDRRATQEMIARRGIRLEAFDIARSIGEAKAQVVRMGDLLGAEKAAVALNGGIEASLDRLKAAAGPRPPLRVLPYSRRGWVEGGGTILGDLLRAAGLANAGDEAGFGRGGFIGLEALILLKPDAIVVTTETPEAEDQGSAMLLHPAIQALFPSERIIVLSEPLTVCGGPA